MERIVDIFRKRKNREHIFMKELFRAILALPFKKVFSRVRVWLEQPQIIALFITINCYISNIDQISS